MVLHPISPSLNMSIKLHFSQINNYAINFQCFIVGGIRAAPNPQENEKEIPGKSCIQGLATKADHMHLTPELHQVRKTSQVQ